MKEEKIEAIKNQPKLGLVFDIQVFLNFTNFY